MEQPSNGGNFNTFTIGFVIGAILGVLYAPQKGEETRNTLKKLLEDAKDMGEIAKHKGGQVAQNVQPVVAEIKQQITPIVEEIKPMVEPVVEEVKDEAKEAMEEIVEPAMEKAKEDLTQTIEEARQDLRERIAKRRPRYFKGV